MKDPDFSLQIIDIPGDEKSLERIRSRIIGRNGRTREIIEEMTGVKVSVYGKTISIIGKYKNIKIAKEAIDKLIRGSMHSVVYAFLEKSHRELRESEML